MVTALVLQTSAGLKRLASPPSPPFLRLTPAALVAPPGLPHPPLLSCQPSFLHPPPSPTANAPPVPRVSFTFLSEPRLPPVNSPIKDRTNIVQGSPFAAPSQQTKKRRRRAPKEGEPTQQAKRLKKNPPVRDTSRKERMEHGRKKKAARQAVQTSTGWAKLRRSRLVKPSNKAHTLEDVRLMGLRVVSWDGV